MRRVVLVFAAAFVCAAPAHAASLSVAPHDFSPHHATLQVSAKLGVQRQVGVSLVTLGGRRLGWIVPPAARTTLAVGWNGLIDGKLVPDGTYVVKLVYRSSILATTPLHIDTHAPQLLLHATNGASRFAGDDQLLTTISPNGDGFRDRANVDVPAARAGDRDDGRHAHRQGAEHDLHADEHARAGRAHADLGTGADDQPAHVPGPRHRGRPRRQPRRLRRRRTRSSAAHPKGVVVRVQGIDAGFGQPSYAPGQVGAHPHRDRRSRRSRLRIFHSGPEQVVTYADNQMAGVDIGDAADADRLVAAPQTQPALDLVPHPERARAVSTTPSSTRRRRPRRLRAVRRAPGGARGDRAACSSSCRRTRWQAYNFQDADGNGYGDTWYAGPPNRVVDLVAHVHRARRPAALLPLRPAVPALALLVRQERGVHLRLRLRPIANGDDLARAYDLVVFEGHEEYVTTHEYDVVTALPRPRRQPDVPLGEQLLLEGRQDRARCCARSRSGATPAGPRRR